MNNEYNVFMYIYNKYNLKKNIIDIDEYILKTDIIKNYNNNEQIINYNYYTFFRITTYQNIILQYNLYFDKKIELETAKPPFKLLISSSKNYYGLHRYGWKNVIKNFLKSTYTEYDPFHYINPNFEWIQYALKYNLNTYNETKKHFILNQDKKFLNQDKNFLNQDKSFLNIKCIIFDDWLEASITHNTKMYINKPKIDIITFAHDPEIYNYNGNNKIIKDKIKDNKYNKPFFLQIKDNIKYLITLSENHSLYFKNNINFNKKTIITNMIHPMETIDISFSIANYLSNPNKKIYILGWWLRKYDIFINLNCKNHKKIILIKDLEGDWITTYVNYELRTVINYNKYDNMINNKKLSDIEITFLASCNIEILYYISNNEYDEIFKNNIIFLDFYETSANNVILECILMNTPILVKKLSATIEYLGIEYPFFFDTLEEANIKINDIDLIIKTHEYLKNMSKEKFTYNYFNQQIKNLIINFP